MKNLSRRKDFDKELNGFLLLGREIKWCNEKYFVRKRLLHKGYQLSKIKYTEIDDVDDFGTHITHFTPYYTLIREFETKEELIYWFID